MSGFSDIMKRAKKIVDCKETKSKWGLCEDCNKRKKLFEYPDIEGQVWFLCEQCIDEAVKEEL